jgi:translation initiation factor IF-2
VPISAKTGMGIDDLLEAILNQAELLELKAVKKRSGPWCGD